MRRDYISPEFLYEKVFGTYNMIEESSFMSSKMLNIDNEIYLNNQGIIYYQNTTNEQIDLAIENTLSPITYSASDDKKLNSELIIDNAQSDAQKNSQTRYILNISLSDILSNYLFSTLKQYRTFEGVRNNMCYSNDVNSSIRSYIKNNITNKYKFSNIDLYIRYNSIETQTFKRFDNKWSNDNSIVDKEFINKRIQTNTEYDQSSIVVNFNQEKNSDLFCFDYFFNILWTKI